VAWTRPASADKRVVSGVGCQVTFDAADPERLGCFWADVLGYIEQPTPEGFPSWDDSLDSIGIPANQQGRMFAVVDPDDIRPRLLFQRGARRQDRRHEPGPS
jgi:hypothetical protein